VASCLNKPEYLVFYASWTEWRNTFSFEIFGTRGKLEISGLGGSYGTERLTHYKMSSTMTLPEVTAWEWLAPDQSWEKELKLFLSDAPTSGEDALAVLRLVEQVYKKNDTMK
jgi:predicted dehydrogenase